MRRKILSIATAATLSLGLIACEKRIEEAKINTTHPASEERMESTESEKSADGHRETIPAENFILEEELTGYRKYTNDFLSLEYPGQWMVLENQTEDGISVSFYDSEQKERIIFSFFVGANFWVNLDYTREDYLEILSQNYYQPEVVELSSVQIDGFDAHKLIFSYIDHEQKVTEVDYFIIEDVRGYHFQYSCPGQLSEENMAQIEEIMKTVRFLYASSRPLL